MQEAFQRVRDARSELDDLEFDLETERSTLSELKAEREELQETIEEAMGCPIRSSMVVEEVGTDDLGRPVYAAVNALDADAVLLANRVKVHTDFCGDVESGLSKIAVVGLGKHRGAESLHNAAIAADFTDVIEDRMDVLLAETSIVGGITLVENANDRAAHIEGINSAAIPNREPELLDLAREEFSDLPVDDLDMLVVDEAGKDKSGTGMDTNVLGRYYFHGETEPKTPNVTRVYVRSLTGPSHGNALGVGLADFVHQQFVADIDFEDTYVNIATSGETRRAKIPFVVPDDETALLLACSTTGVSDPDALRIARIPSTMEPNRLVISEPVATELRERDDFEVGLSRSLAFEDGSTAGITYTTFGDSSLAKEYAEAFGNGKTATVDNFTGKKLSLGQDKGHEAEFDAFVDAILSGEPSPLPLEQAVEVSAASFAINEAIRSGDGVTVDLDRHL
jgi:hypothetical protein